MIIDIVVVLAVLASALISFMRGFIREVLTIAGVVGGLLAAVFVGPLFAPMVRTWYGVGVEGKEPAKLFDIIPMEIVADVTTYGVIFITVVIIISVLSHMISGAAKAMGLGPVDRTLGVIFGVARALVLLGLVYLPFHLLMDDSRKEEFFKDSKTHFFIEKMASAMAAYLPESDDVEKKVDDATSDIIKKKLEEEDLLGNGRKASEKTSDTTAPAEDEGYKKEQRQKLDQLFNEPVVNE